MNKERDVSGGAELESQKMKKHQIKWKSKYCKRKDEKTGRERVSERKKEERERDGKIDVIDR